MKKFFVYKCKLSLSLALLYLVGLFINKLKTKFNNHFLQNDFKYKRNFFARARQMPSKVLFAGKKKRRPRPFGPLRAKIVIVGNSI